MPAIELGEASTKRTKYMSIILSFLLVVSVISVPISVTAATNPSATTTQTQLTHGQDTAISGSSVNSDLGDISWSQSSQIKIYDIDYTETKKESQVTIGEDVIDTDYYLDDKGGWKRIENRGLSGGFYYPDYINTVTRTYEFKINDETKTDLGQNTGPDRDFDDAIEVRYGLWNDASERPADDIYDDSEFVTNSAEWEFDTFHDGYLQTSSVTMPTEEINQNGRTLFLDARVLGDDDPGFLGDNDNDDAVIGYKHTTYVRGSNLEDGYQFSLSDRKVQSVAGDATLSFDFIKVASQRGAGEGKQISIKVNGNEVFSEFDNYKSGERNIQFQSSYLKSGENEVTVSGPSLSNRGAYGFTISDLSVNAPTNSDFDSDGVKNWNDDAPNEPEDDDGYQDGDGVPDPDNDNDGIPDSEDGAPDKPEDDDGYQDGDGVPDPDNDNDGLRDENDPYPDDKDGDSDGVTDPVDEAPRDPEDNDGYQDNDGVPDPDNDGDGLVDENDPFPNDEDGDSDGVKDPNDGAPRDPEDNDGYQDGDGVPDPDNDKDGIPDSEDDAPNEKEDIDNCQDSDGAPEPEGTCTSDSDGDGIPDSEDGAPNQPEDIDGYEDKDGVPDPDNDGDGLRDENDPYPDDKDGDSDGVKDPNDEAPRDPEDNDGYQDGDGVPDPDNDNDGIPDSEDDAPNEKEDIDNCQDSDGAPEPEGTCTSDSDGDGIPDSEDGAPNQPEDNDGYEDSDGVPDPDNDNDGIPDVEDSAPDEPEDDDGCEDSDGKPEPAGTCGDDDPNTANVTLSATDVATEAGTNVTVSFNLTNAGERRGLILNATQSSNNISVVSQSSDDGSWNANESKWLWQTIEPNQTVTPSLIFKVPGSTPGGTDYTVSARALTDNGTVAVTNATISVDVPVKEAIDTNDNKEIDDSEILTAIDYWRTDSTVPHTDDQTIGDLKILELIELWRNNTEI